MFSIGKIITENIFFSNIGIKKYPTISEKNKGVETNKAELHQLNIIYCNNLLSFNKLHSYSSYYSSLPYIIFSFNSIYLYIYTSYFIFQQQRI